MTVWPTILGVGGVAVTAGTLMVPAVRRMAFGSVEHDWLCHQLELDGIDHDGMTCRTKSGTITRVYRLAGLPYDTKPESEQQALYLARAEFFHFAATRKVVVRLFGVKRRRSTIYPATWPAPALAEIGAAEAARHRDSFDVRWYMTLQSKDLYRLAEVDDRAASILSGHGLQRLQRPGNPDAFCPLTTFWNYLYSGDLRDDLKAVSRSISANIPASDLIFDKRDGSVLAHQPTPYHYRTIAAHLWPDQNSGQTLHDLMALPYELEVSLVMIPAMKEAALGLLKRRTKTPFVPMSAVDQCHAAIQLLSEGTTSQFKTQFAVIPRGQSEEDINTVVSEVATVLTDSSIDYAVQTKAAPVVWFNRLPEHEHLPHPLTLYANNAAALFPFESSPRGQDKSLYGPAPVRSFDTGSGQTYAFQFHNSTRPKALGHYSVFAPSNSGKSTLMMYLLSGLAKFDGVRSFVFDSQEGNRFMVEVMGGKYQSYDKLELNPLDVADTRRNRHRLGLLVRSMLGEVGHEKGIDDILRRTADNAFQMPLGQRTFNNIFSVTFTDRSSAKEAFAQWVVDKKGREGQYAHVFNCERDSLSGFLDQSYLVGINMNEALEDPILGPPVVAHIANAIERIARSGDLRGFNLFVDEAANLLRNPSFCDFVRVAYREYRKLGGAVGLAFQEPKALMQSGLAEEVLQNTATFLIFPSPNTKPKDWEPFNLNDEQIRFIISAPAGRKVLVVKRDAATGFNESVILDIDLDPLGACKRFFDSGHDAVARLHNLQSQWGEEWFAHV